MVSDNATGPTCRTCGRGIQWVVNQNGNRLPVDARKANGSVYRIVGDGKDGPFVEAVEPDIYVSHFLTCPQAAVHSKRRTG